MAQVYRFYCYNTAIDNALDIKLHFMSDNDVKIPMEKIHKFIAYV